MPAPLHDRGVISRYREYLPVSDATPVISLNEGSTPLIHSPRLSEKAGAEVYIKYEGLNPTGSFKDRGMTVAISKAVEEGAQTVICASTGNTSAAAAAYAARAGIQCAVILPAGKIASGKLVQAYLYGAKVIAIKGNFDDALRLVRELGGENGIAIVNSINPHRIEGQKTGSFEIIEELGDAPDMHILPVGNAGNITAYWKGYREFAEARRSTRLPRMVGFQAAGSAPIFYNKVVDQPNTVATAIRIGNPASWEGASNAVTQSGGSINIATDEEILAAQSWLAKNEGIFVEPASAASVAGLFKLLETGAPLNASSIVLTVTGHGLKDPDTALTTGDYHPIEAEADLDTVRSVLAQS
ncbi:MAG: threonine synthase [Verrucomicrobia bacterium 61-8]|nr:threonine synthase [Verrucomicrobiota bacterium]OJV03769.1 MAG: threonine synthase [Verrucomicrobia bacterium 61-8]